jgi:hypothetical protein
LDCIGKSYETDRWNGQVNDGEFSVQLACIGKGCAPQGFTPHRLITIRKYYYVGSTRVAMRKREHPLLSALGPPRFDDGDAQCGWLEVLGAEVLPLGRGALYNPNFDTYGEAVYRAGE